MAHNAALLAARCKKVDELNAAHLRHLAGGVPPSQVGYHLCEAADTWLNNGRSITHEPTRARVDAQLSSHPRRLHLRQGQRVIITVNKRRQHPDYANGTVATVVSVSTSARTGGAVVHVRPDEWDAHDPQPPIAIQPHVAQCVVDSKPAQRRQLSLIPAHAMTVHRVQGMTLENDVHILLNSEFFADGQAYVAISRVRRLEQIHFWALDVTRFKAARGVASAYDSLRRRPLTPAFIDAHCAARQTVRNCQLLPLSGGVGS